jgi:hypothetical protein
MDPALAPALVYEFEPAPLETGGWSSVRVVGVPLEWMFSKDVEDSRTRM